MSWIGPEFFERDPVVCARELIGATMVWDSCEGRIVETEAYAAAGDPACHTFNRPSAREFVAQRPAGTAYIYLNYGVHWLFNLLVKGPKGAGFVLFRALEPTKGLDLMRARRPDRPDSRLCAGPGCLTRALGISGQDHGKPLLTEAGRGLLHGPCPEIIADGRIGISRAKEFPWRFTAKGSRAVSKRPNLGG